MSEGPKLNENNILSCEGCDNFNLHPYYGNICKLGYSNPDDLEYLESINCEGKLCPFYKQDIRNIKINKLLE